MNIQQALPNRVPTKAESLKNRVLEIARQLLNNYEEDIESGIEDGTYEANDNIETRKLIAEAKVIFDEFEQHQPAIYICVKGGNIQGASANCEIDFNKYDVDNYEAGKDLDEQTPDEWDEQIKALTESNEIKPVY